VGKIIMQNSSGLNPIIRMSGKPEYYEYLINLVQNVEGTIVELGVGAAKSAKFLCRASKKLGVLRDYWGFDSFQGFPSPSKEDHHSTNFCIKKGYFRPYWCKTQVEAANRIKEFCNYPEKRLHFVEGYFSTELFTQKYNQSSIALLHLDCDLYQSYNMGLNFFYNYVAYGGILAFDEYLDPLNLKEWPGAAKAIPIDEWMQTTDYTKSDFSEAVWNNENGRLVHKFFLRKI
jgi:O-methyltransferase